MFPQLDINQASLLQKKTGSMEFFFHIIRWCLQCKKRMKTIKLTLGALDYLSDDVIPCLSLSGSSYIQEEVQGNWEPVVTCRQETSATIQ